MDVLRPGIIGLELFGLLSLMMMVALIQTHHSRMLPELDSLTVTLRISNSATMTKIPSQTNDQGNRDSLIMRVKVSK